MSTPPTLDAWMARLAGGERAAFQPVFSQSWPPVVRFCKAVLKHDSDANDAAQQAMMKLFTRASEYDPKRPALPWVLGIAAWECRTLRKKQQRRKEAALDTSPDLPITSRDLEAHDLENAALQALGALSDLDREALRAVFWEESASVAGATLRKRKERALERLRTAFRRLYGFD